MASGGRRTNRRQNRQLLTYEYYPGAGGETEISCCVKYTVFGFNVVFWIIGFLMLAVGVWAQLEKNNPYSQLNRLSKFYLDPALLLSVIGLFTFVVGFSGCLGALRENTTFLALYSTLLGLLLLAELIIVILAFVSKDWIETELKTRLDDMIILYRDDPDLQALIDWMQTDWKCCGINRPDDWDMNIYFNKSATSLKSEEAGGVPFSCCINGRDLENFACGHNVRVKHAKDMNHLIFIEGCLPKLQQWLNNNFVYVGTSIFIVAIIQFLGICFAQDLKSDIFAQRAKWSRH
uniref:Tetraspanin n=1 Tax=Panagrolaimus sp. JU765 TaxID=591449 RepID=A0AC34PUE7_9BILA